jgi:tetratricopeptide (TPR) repeat protein
MRTTITILAGMLVAFATGCQSGKPAYTADEYYQQGLANENGGNVKRAMMHYGQAVDADPMHAKSLYHLGVLQTNSGDYMRAIPTWRQYVHATHNSAEAWSNLGWTYEKMGWQRNAEGAYRSGIIVNASSKACQTNLGLFLARHNQPSEALLHLQVAMTPAEAHYNLAMIYREQGQTAKEKLELAKSNEHDHSTVASIDDEADQDETPVTNEDESAFFNDSAIDSQAQSSDEDEMQQSTETETAPSIDDAQTQVDETDLLINPDPH